MVAFVDTSALFACLDADDKDHEAARQAWYDLGQAGEGLVSSNYVVLETIALLTNRLGFQPVREFQTEFVPFLHVHWINESLHQQAVAGFLMAGRRKLSLVDCTSFEVMRELRLQTAFAFDPHFAEQGFTCMP